MRTGQKSAIEIAWPALVNWLGFEMRLAQRQRWRAAWIFSIDCWIASIFWQVGMTRKLTLFLSVHSCTWKSWICLPLVTHESLYNYLRLEGLFSDENQSAGLSHRQPQNGILHKGQGTQGTFHDEASTSRLTRQWEFHGIVQLTRRNVLKKKHAWPTFIRSTENSENVAFPVSFPLWRAKFTSFSSSKIKPGIALKWSGLERQKFIWICVYGLRIGHIVIDPNVPNLG